MGKDKTTVRMQIEATLCRLTVMIMFHICFNVQMYMNIHKVNKVFL